MGFMYLLKSRNPRGATKSYRWRDDGLIDRVESYDAGYEFLTARLPREGSIDTIDDLSELLTSAEDEPDWFAVRGELRSRQEYVDNVNRQYLEKNDFPHWMEPPGGQNWVMMDIDGMGLPFWFNGREDLPDLAEWVAGRLPECFHDVSFHYHYSSSAGLIKVGDELYKPGFDSVRVHLWFMLDRYVCSQSIRRWVKKHGSKEVPMDPAPFNPVQPHYTADPVFEGGDDPIAGARSGLIRRSRDVVTCPDDWVDLERYEQETKAQIRTVRMFSSFSGGRRDDESYCQGALRSAVDRIKSAREGLRHDTVYCESAAIGELVHRFSEPEAVRELVAAAQSTVEPSRHKEMARTVLEAIEKGKMSPRHAETVSAPAEPVQRNDLAEIQLARFRERVEPALPDRVKERLSEVTPDTRKDVYSLAEKYRSLGWTHDVKGPLSDLDAVITAHLVVMNGLEERVHGQSKSG